MHVLEIFLWSKQKCRCLFPVLWSGCDVLCCNMEASKTNKGNESLLGSCRKFSVVTKSRVSGGSGSGEQSDRRQIIGCLKIAVAYWTQQLKISGSLCQQAGHISWLYRCSGIFGTQQDVIKNTEADSKMHKYLLLVLLSCLFLTLTAAHKSLWSFIWPQIAFRI